MSAEGFEIVVAEGFMPSAMARLAAAGRVIEVPAGDQAALLDALRTADALLVRTATRVTAVLMEAAPRLRVIGRGGTGLDGIDLAAARKRGITVVYTPAASTEAVADLTVGLMLALLRRIPDGDGAVRQGQFKAWRDQQAAAELSTLTLGIVGMGRIGRAVAHRCHFGFGMSVVYYDIVPVDPGHVPAAPMAWHDLLGAADVISLHVPLSDTTRGLIGAEALERCKPGALLINTARGAVVDEAALAAALTAGRIGGAAIDVFDPEPPPADHPLLHAPHTVLTPHIGARTRGALERMNAVVDDVVRVLQGQAPRHPVE